MRSFCFSFNKHIAIKIMKKLIIWTLVFICSCFSKIQGQANSQNSSQQDLVFFTWNVEHLAENNDEGCLPRNNKDYVRLRDFAKTLKADIVALQEVESAKAVYRLFQKTDWNVVMSDRAPSESYSCRENGNQSTQQKVAIAVRKGIEFINIGDYEQLGLDIEGLRYGVVIRLTATPAPIDIMAVHLKSGCFVDNYAASNRKACEIFETQAPLLDHWVESNVNEERAFVVLGDFNHRISNSDNKLWRELTTMEQDSLSILNSMRNLPGCHPKYPEPIDHILLGPSTSQFYKKGSEAVHYYINPDSSMTESDMLSDHCPVSVELNFYQ